MKRHLIRLRRISSLGLLLAVWFGYRGTQGLAVATAAETHPTSRDADKHFEHGVALYMEADYRGALVEFLRAYELAPNGVVLFNIGETQYQLRDYAGALATFERYQAEAPQSDAHRALVDANVKELRTRVGRLTIATVPVEAEISVDDRVIGKTPFDRPVVVGIGRLTVRASAPGHLPVARSVDVAAEDNVSITLDLPASPSVRPEVTMQVPASDSEAPTRPMDRAAWRKAGWIATGMLAAGAVGVGLWAYDESRALRDARNGYPTRSDTMQSLSHRTLVLSVIADSVGAAALVVGGITLYSSISAKDGAGAKEVSRNGVTLTRVSAGLGSMRLEMTF